MKACLLALALFASLLAFTPHPAKADIGPCNNCADSSQVSDGSGAPLLMP